MPERPRSLPIRGSIFIKLVAIMLAMACCLLLMVLGFFRFVVDPGVGAAIGRVLEAYAEAVAAQSPDLESASVIARRVGMSISYEGPKGTWTTEADSSPVLEHSPGHTSAAAAPSWTHTRRVVRAPDGGCYSFSWEFGRSIKAAHDKLIGLLLLIMVGVVFTAHQVLRRALRPVRLLYAGVARVSEGDFDVEVPSQSRDELGALTDAFNQMARRVKEMISLRDQLLLDVSHELRSPLTRMKVALALVPDGEKRSRMVTDVAEMEAMITGILELERLRDGRGIRTEQRDLLPIILEVAAPFRDAHPGVAITCPATEVPLNVDVERIRTLLRNVLDNAFKYSLADSRPVEIAVLPSKDGVVIRVSDDGPGISEADLHNVFEPFFRADRSRSKKTGGYGLGLSICKRVMEAHGGQIAAENNPGRGTAIIFTFRR
jgi:signal transduction histidine kinase